MTSFKLQNRNSRYGMKQGRRAKKGVFITASDFTKEAEDYSATIDTTIVLINGMQLAHLMIEYGIGVTKVASYGYSPDRF